MGNSKVHLLIINDNESTHQELLKALTIYHDSQLFNPADHLTNNQSTVRLIESQQLTFPAFEIEDAKKHKDGLKKVAKGIKEGKQFSIVFINLKTSDETDELATIKQMWALDPEIQMILCSDNSDYDWDQAIKKLRMGDNYLILKKPIDTLALKQIIKALISKWLLTKQVKEQNEHLDKALEERTHSLQHSISLLRSTIDSATDGILVVDLNKKIIDFNKKFLVMWNIPESLAITKDWKLISAHMNKQLANPAKTKIKTQAIEAAHSDSSKQVVTFKNGLVIECYSQPHRMNDKTIGQIWSYHDITERANLELKLEFQASHDTLTGLPNRIIVIDRLINAIDRAYRNKKGVAVLFIDLDRFKLVNDSLNHSTGDALLRQIASRLSALVRKDDTLARLGGDEFIMILPDLDRNESSLNIAAKILKSFKSPFPIAGYQITMSPSIGISVYPADGENVDELLRNADLAMYQAKAQGGNQVQFYTKELNEQTNQRFKIEAELNQALINKEFFLVYQPQFDINNENLLSIEALLRWNHPIRGCLAPIDFMRVAEESGLIIPIGEWVIREVCLQINAWTKKNIPVKTIAINVATQQLKQVNFATSVAAILEEYDVDPGYLEFEVTENIVMTHMDVIQMINQLSAMGIKIVLDDFGTGKSSLNYLKHIQIDRLKIDPSFIKNIALSRNDEVIIEAIIAMSHSFNFKVLAEGVEKQNQMAYLKQQNCDQVQGFLLSEPLVASSLESFLLQFATDRTSKN